MVERGCKWSAQLQGSELELRGQLGGRKWGFGGPSCLMWGVRQWTSHTLLAPSKLSGLILAQTWTSWCSGQNWSMKISSQVLGRILHHLHVCKLSRFPFLPSPFIDSSTMAHSSFLPHPPFPLPKFAVPSLLCPCFLSSCSFSPVFSAPSLLGSLVLSPSFSSFTCDPLTSCCSFFFSKDLSMTWEEENGLHEVFVWKETRAEAALITGSH